MNKLIANSLNALRRTFSLERLSAADRGFVKFATFAGVLCISSYFYLTLKIAAKTDSFIAFILGFGLSLMMLVLRFVSHKIFTGAAAICQSTPCRFRSTAFLESFAALRFVAALFLVSQPLIGPKYSEAVAYATSSATNSAPVSQNADGASSGEQPNATTEKKLDEILMAVSISVWLCFLGVMSLHPELTGAKISHNVTASKELGGILSFMAKLLLKGIPCLYILTMLRFSIGVIKTIFSFPSTNENYVSFLHEFPETGLLICAWMAAPFLLYLSCLIYFRIAEKLGADVSLSSEASTSDDSR